MDKNQNPDMVFCGKCSNPKRLGLFINERSGNYFFGKESVHADNRRIPSKVWIDEDGYICVTIDSIK